MSAATLKPLFRPDALAAAMAGFAPGPGATAARPGLAVWTARLSDPKWVASKKETELLPDFIRDVFAGVLGYVPPPADPYTLKQQALSAVDGTFPDAVVGHFGAGPDRPRLVLEGKGPRDPLDRPFAGRKVSAVDQGMKYAVQMQLDWYAVTNLKEVRLYSKRRDTRTAERFDLAAVAADDAAFRRFVFLLGADRVLAPAGNHLDALLEASDRRGRELTDAYYRDYRDLRAGMFAALRAANPSVPPGELLALTQKLLDRVLFVAFCEDRGLLPAGIIARAYAHADPFNPRPIYHNFVGLFRAVDRGNAALDVWRYNGGLFAPDPALDGLAVPDPVCEGFKTLAEYEYGGGADPAAGKLIDVDILGHIFEQSISDLEELHRAVAADPTADPAGPGKRKRDGAFYTPPVITRYVVEQTLGPVLADRFERQRADHQGRLKGPVAKVLADPTGFDPDALKPAPKAALVAFWRAWLTDLETVRVIDPACGSGAFLIEAFDQLFRQYQRADGYLQSLGAGEGLFAPKESILSRNLFGMDRNGEAVEIARLSCWVKTAEVGKVLTALDRNIVAGNSVAGPDPAVSPRERWAAVFPDAFAAGGFDAVIGNPPYIRQEWIAADKPYLQRHYAAYDGAADLYVYFYELGLNLLKPGGRLGYIVTNKWLKAGYGENLRKLYTEAAWVETLVDLGHNKEVFPDADVFPCILTARKPDAGPPPATARVCVLPRELTRLDDLARQVADTGSDVPRTRFTADPWTLEPPGVAALMAKIKAAGVPLKEFIGGSPLYGIKTGFNDAYLIDTPMKQKLVAADPATIELFRPYLRGQDLERWYAPGAGLWMIILKSSSNHSWPWAGLPVDQAESVFRRTFPSLHSHFASYRPQLNGRSDQGEYWWELRACDYWDKFDRPKVMYQEIQYHPTYLLDTTRLMANNKVFFLPTDDRWLLAVLNSPLGWWHNWRYLPHMKDEALTPAGFLMSNFPATEPTSAARTKAEAQVDRLRAIAVEQHAQRALVLDWLRTQFAVGKPTKKLANLVGLSADAFATEVKKARGAKQALSATGLKRLKDEHAASVVPMQALAAETVNLEQELSDLVNTAYGLTPADVALMWETAPPRMPFTLPAGV